MAVIFSFPGKMGDALHQWPVVYHWAQKTGKKCELWLDEKTCAPLVPLFEAQPCVEAVKLIGGVENYSCGGQPFHMNIPTKAFAGNTVYHLGLRGFPQRQLTLEAFEASKVPVTVDPDVLASEISLEVPAPTRYNRLVLHGQPVYAHSNGTPTFWKFLYSIRTELEAMFDEIVFVGSDRDREIGLRTYPDWSAFVDGGDFLKLAGYIAGSRAMIGVGSSPIVLAGLLGIPAIRVHDPIGADAPKAIWNNIAENNLNATEIELRKMWPEWRDKWLTQKAVDTTSAVS